jgi:protein-S-isoprenylcysteine O-methyltransferase Ste14
VYTVDRVIFILVNVLGVFVGVYYEEQKLRVKFKGYREYERKVPYKFVPYVV